jgi:O-antigen ligase
MQKNKLNRAKFIVLIILAYFTPLTFWPIRSWFSFPIYDLSFGILGCLFLFGQWKRNLALLKFKPRDWALVLLTLVIVVNGLTKGEWASASSFLEMLILFAIVVFGEFSRTELETSVMVLVASGLSVSLIGLDEYLTGSSRIISTLTNPNLLSGYLTLLLPISFSLWLHPKKRYKVFGIITTSLLGFTLVTTLTRSGYLCVLIGMAGFAVIKERKLLPIILVYSLVFGMLISPAQSRFSEIKDLGNISSYSTQIQDTKAPTTFSSLDSRLRLWSYASREFAKVPITGIGIGKFQPNLTQFIATHPASAQFFTFGVEDVHNSYLRLLVETGIFGLLGFLAILGLWLIPMGKSLWTKRHSYGSLEFGIFFGVIAFLIHNLTNSLLFRVPTSYAFWICLAILARFTIIEHNKEEIIVQGGRINDTSRFTQ